MGGVSVSIFCVCVGFGCVLGSGWFGFMVVVRCGLVGLGLILPVLGG